MKPVRPNDQDPSSNPSGPQAEATGAALSCPIAVQKDGDGLVDVDRSRLADALLPAVLAAGRVEMTAWDDKDISVNEKPDHTPVTEADHQAEALLQAALADVAPGILVVGEETHEETRAPALNEPFFLVDPLDGTRDFIAHEPEFTVNIALIELGRPVFGMIYAPALDALFVTTAADHSIMALIDCKATTTTLKGCRTRPIQTRPSDPENLIAFTSRRHTDETTRETLNRIGNCETTPMGSSLKFCLIARGYGDLYVRRGPTSEWDTAAGEAILQAAGGEVTAFDGTLLTYGGAERKYRNPHFVAWGDPALRKRATL